MESSNELYDSLVKLQQDLPKLQKTAENPFFKSKYVPLDQILDKVIPVLGKHGFALVQSVGYTDTYEPTLDTRLIHISGDIISSSMLLLSKTPDPQAQGSAITYARRYALVSILGMTIGEDDDGNAATTAEARVQEIARQQTAPQAIKEIGKILDDKGIDDPEMKQRIVRKLSDGQPLNTSGIARLKKEIVLAAPDTLLTLGEE